MPPRRLLAQPLPSRADVVIAADARPLPSSRSLRAIWPSRRPAQLADLASGDTGHPVKHEVDGLHVILATIRQSVW